MRTQEIVFLDIDPNCDDANVVWRWRKLFVFLMRHRVDDPKKQSARLLRAQLKVDLKHL